MKIADFQLPGIRGPEEAQRAVDLLRRMPGVVDARGEHRTRIFVVQWNEPATLDGLMSALGGLGFVPKYK